MSLLISAHRGSAPGNGQPRPDEVSQRLAVASDSRSPIATDSSSFCVVGGTFGP
uniref:Uncharacterized protein n=1 Tax=Anguilla anguilla TaxID=7936 RepID=A0A0E9RUZ8_ANGAN